MRRYRLMNKRALFAVIAASLCLGVGPLAAQASANSGHHRHDGMPIAWTRTTDPSVTGQPGTQFCNAEGRCLDSFGSGSTASGDLVGTTRSIALFAGNGPNALASTVVGISALAIYTVTQSPCGAGTFVIMAFGSTNTTGRWEIVAGGGTGDLVNVSGSGTVASSPDLLVSDYTGRISCGSGT